MLRRIFESIRFAFSQLDRFTKKPQSINLDLCLLSGAPRAAGAFVQVVVRAGDPIQLRAQLIDTHSQNQVTKPDEKPKTPHSMVWSFIDPIMKALHHSEV